MTMMTNTKKSAGLEPIKKCEKCGKPVEMYLPNPRTGTPQKVGIMCDCKKAERQQWEEQNKRNAEETARRRNIANSLMSAKGKNARFEKISETPENAKIIQSAKNYCERWKNRQDNEDFKGLLFYGKPGRGKTTIAYCIANRFLEMGAEVKAITANSFIDLDFKNAVTASDFAKVDLVVLDDLGAEHKTKYSTAKIYALIDAVYNAQKPLIITTNLDIPSLKIHLTGEDGICRAYDRLVEMVQIVEVTGENHRIQNASNRFGGFSSADKN